ncbi:ComF family protein [Effusibacillus pohliae]|uniref:ComF family protein n=1 Tax=Effusibacillus pohliae TaxID=232270 RepID=UPI000373AAE4|nr:ComF family protein [Effusibacillus pohliae]
MSLRDYWETFLGLLFPQERSCIACRGPLPETDLPGQGWGREPANGRQLWPKGEAGANGRDGLPLTLEEGQWLPEKELCARCQSVLLPIEPPLCLLCGRHLSEPGRCPECERETSFVLSRSFGKYEGVLRDLLHRFKFSREEDLGIVLGACLQAAWDLHMAHFPIDWLVPVPIHPERLKERGYNQAERLALQLSSYSKIPCLPALRRTLYLKGQATRDRRERLKALQGTYVCDPDFSDRICGACILLVDDIYTTGSTAEACAHALRQAGAGQVYVLTVAR